MCFSREADHPMSALTVLMADFQLSAVCLLSKRGRRGLLVATDFHSFLSHCCRISFKMKTASLVCKPNSGRKTNDFFFLQYQTRGFLSVFNLLAEHLCQLVPPGPSVTSIALPPVIQQAHSVHWSHAWCTWLARIGFGVRDGLEVLPPLSQMSFCVCSIPGAGSWCLG